MGTILGKSFLYWGPTIGVNACTGTPASTSPIFANAGPSKFVSYDHITIHSSVDESCSLYHLATCSCTAVKPAAAI